MRGGPMLLAVGALGSFTQALLLFFYCIRTLSAPNPPHRSVYLIKGWHEQPPPAAAILLRQRCRRG